MQRKSNFKAQMVSQDYGLPPREALRHHTISWDIQLCIFKPFSTAIFKACWSPFLVGTYASVNVSEVQHVLNFGCKVALFFHKAKGHSLRWVTDHVRE